ncbi:MAG: Nucleoid occlusion factor SlmA [Sodalis sp.]|nr:MAG: Nucleoid occlusion factor SlmA [Sodalis sp.]
MQLRQVSRERKLREGEAFELDESLVASQLLAFCEGMLLRFVRTEFKYWPTQEFELRRPLWWRSSTERRGGSGAPPPVNVSASLPALRAERPSRPVSSDTILLLIGTDRSEMVDHFAFSFR